MEKPELIKKTGRSKNGHRLAIFRCECGNMFETSINHVRTNHTKSCGCLKIKKPARITHGMANTRPYKIWAGIIKRCTNKKAQNYQYYGGRGIGVCNEWMLFVNFWNDMKDGYADNLTIDRIDTNRGYSKQNCKWSTRLEQSNNQRSNHLIEYNGEMKTIAELVRMCPYPIKYRSFHSKLTKSKFTIDEIFTNKCKRRSRKKSINY